MPQELVVTRLPGLLLKWQLLSSRFFHGPHCAIFSGSKCISWAWPAEGGWLVLKSAVCNIPTWLQPTPSFVIRELSMPDTINCFYWCSIMFGHFSSLQWIQPHLTWVSWMRVVALCSSFLIVAGWPWRIACVVPWRRSQHQLSNKTWVDEDPNIPQPRHAKNIIIYYIC